MLFHSGNSWVNSMPLSRFIAIFAYAVGTLIAPLSVQASNADKDLYGDINDSWERFGAVYGRARQIDLVGMHLHGGLHCRLK